MNTSYDNVTPTNDGNTLASTVVKTDVGAKDGQNKCPKCGSSEISVNENKGCLRCDFCRHEFEAEKVEGLETDISKLEGQIIGSGAQDIQADTNEILTFKCSSCGSEVVIDTSSQTQARCHWCRNILSVNEQIPNGSIPDVVLPFGVRKEDAKIEIEKFVGKRKFFANPNFKKEFTTNNIMGVYFPYMVIDINAHSLLSGQAEKTMRKYSKKRGDHYETYYDADLYNVERDFDLTIEGLTVESSVDKLTKSNDKTTNVINAIMPFDIENSVKWNANYLRGYSSEKRDTNIESLKPIVEKQAKDIARFATNDTIKEYDRGARWTVENINIKGQQWKSAYLPVWLYSYQQVNGNKKVLHYVAVNARTKETMGSVPLHMPKLVITSLLVEVLGIIAMFNIDWDYSWAFLLAGFLFFFLIYSKYRNKDARHTYEVETRRNISNVKMNDSYVKRITGLSSPKIEGANNTSVSNESLESKVLNGIVSQSGLSNIINNNKGGKI